MRTPNQSLVPKPTEDGMAMVGQGPRAVFLCNTADLSRHRRRVEDIAASDPGQAACCQDQVRRCGGELARFHHAQTRCRNGGEGRSITRLFRRTARAQERRRLPLRGIRSMSLTSLAPPLRRSSTILRLWNASSSTRWATLTMVARVCAARTSAWFSVRKRRHS